MLPKDDRFLVSLAGGRDLVVSARVLIPPVTGF
jgi:hypothetical protein